MGAAVVSFTSAKAPVQTALSAARSRSVDLSPLTAGRSLAVDTRVIPQGAPVFLATTWPATDSQLSRLMVAQDTGGAIKGNVRADFFWGFGPEAGDQAGKMRQQGKLWVLMPIGYVPKTQMPQAQQIQ